MRSMFNGFTDAAGVSQYSIGLLRASEREQVVSLANSIQSPSHLVMARKSLPDAVCGRVKASLLALDKSDPADKALFIKLYGVQGYADVTLGHFPEIAEIAAGYGFVEHPETFAKPAKP